MQDEISLPHFSQEKTDRQTSSYPMESQWGRYVYRVVTQLSYIVGENVFMKIMCWSNFTSSLEVTLTNNPVSCSIMWF